MSNLRCKILFIFYVLETVIQPSKPHPSIDIEVNISAARSRAQALYSAHVAQQSTKLTSPNAQNPGTPVELKFDISGAYSRALLTTLTSTQDYSTSRSTQRSKLASNLYFDETVAMYRIPTEIVYRYGSPTEIRYRSKLTRNTWSIYSQQGSSTSDKPSTASRNKREVTTSTPNPGGTWTEVLFRQGSPTEIRYHTRKERTWTAFSQQSTASVNSTRQKRQAFKNNIHSRNDHKY